jgi:transposase
MSKTRVAKKKYRPYDPAAPVELPGDLRLYLPPDHLVFLLCDLVDELDLSAILSVYEQGDGRGQPPYHPVLLTKLLVYAYCQGVTSSRQIMRKTYEDIAFRVLCVDQHPDFRTISDFRERHLAAFRTIFTQTVRLAQRLGQVRLEHLAQDGSKVLANASKHKAMSYERMTQTEERLGQEIAALLAQAQQVDAAEDARYGADQSGDADPAAVAREVQFREARRERIRAAKAALEARAAAEATAAQPVRDDQRGQVQLLAAPAPAGAALAGAAVPTAPTVPAVAPAAALPAVPAAKDQYNFTDPDSRIMPSSQGFVEAYNAEAVVDSYRQIIVACDVCQETTDAAQLQPLFDQARQTTGSWPGQASADSGFWSEPNVQALAAHGIDVYLPPPRPRRGADGTRPTEQSNPAKAQMEAKLATPTGRRTYSQRKETAEPVFGQMKEGRGLRRFRTRGLAKVRGEWALWCATHNLLKLAGVWRKPRPLPRLAAPWPALSPVWAAHSRRRRPVRWGASGRVWASRDSAAAA